jgi:endonuclease III
MARDWWEDSTSRLSDLVARLAPVYDEPSLPADADPFELILAENVVYLADDARRDGAMAALRESVGLTPRAILGAPLEALTEPPELGILPADSARKLREAAEIAVDQFDGDLRAVLELPVAQAKRAFRKFPGIGEPGAEKILLLCGRHAFLAPDSNALRVLVRLAFCQTGKSYSATYSVARRVGEEQLGDDIPRMIAARHVLRRHGQSLCRRQAPACGSCPVASDGPSAGQFRWSTAWLEPGHRRLPPTWFALRAGRPIASRLAPIVGARAAR